MGLRDYQAEAVEATYAFLRTHKTNPCIVLPTGTGKSWVLAQIARDAVQRWGGRALILAHVKELLAQNAEKVSALCGGGDMVGLYSAGLGRRDTSRPVIVAGIQSVYNRAEEFGKFDLILIDECHMIPADGEGMYRHFLDEEKKICPHVRLIGLTATPFRLKGGAICKPENMLNEICYEKGLREMINRGYLSKLTAKGGRTKAALDGIHIRAGEFVEDEAEEAMTQEAVLNSACREIVELTKDRKAVLIFCVSVSHCRKVANRITELSGEECAIVTGETSPADRARTISRLRGEEQAPDLFGAPARPLKFAANVECLTTGTDVPRLDCVVLLRPTNSPGLLLQMVGRGLRLCEGKADCLVLDYGGNIERHGPVDCIRVEEDQPRGGHGGGPKRAKECPQCLELIHPAYAVCPACGYQFPKPDEEEKPRHAAHAALGGILSGEYEDEEVPVYEAKAEIHVKRGAGPEAPRTVQIRYFANMYTSYSEFLCPEHTGYARRKFLEWWDENVPGCPPPNDADECFRLLEEGALRIPKKITVRHTVGEKFDRIRAIEWDEEAAPGDDMPPPISPGNPLAEDDEDLPF